MASSVKMVSLVRRVSLVNHVCIRVTKGRFNDYAVRDNVIVHLGLDVSSFSYNCVCVVDGSNAMAAV